MLSVSTLYFFIANGKQMCYTKLYQAEAYKKWLSNFTDIRGAVYGH